MFNMRAPLQTWANNNAQDREGRNDAYWNQISFVRDTIPGIFARNEDERRNIRENIFVISTHTSCEVRLPVYRIEFAGVAFTLRYNMSNWIISVESEIEVIADFMGLFSTEEAVHSVYCEGFPREVVFDSYAENKHNFTFELRSTHHLFMFFWIFAREVLGKDQ